jgi:hypothetical protein
MPGPLVLHADLELWLTGWLRDRLAARGEPYAAGVVVDNTEPAPGDPFPDRLVVVRSDGGPATSIITDEVAVGITVFAGTKLLPQDGINLALLVRALVDGCALVEPGNPVAAVVESNGPYRVAEQQQRARLYMTFALVVQGTALAE